MADEHDPTAARVVTTGNADDSLTAAADSAELAATPVSYDTPADHYREMARRFAESRDELKHRLRALVKYTMHGMDCGVVRCTCGHSKYSHASVLEWNECNAPDCPCLKFVAQDCSCGLAALLKS